MTVRRPRRSPSLRNDLIDQLAAGEPLHGAELARRTGSTQPPVWRTLRALELSGRVRSRKVGTVRFYEVADRPADPAPGRATTARRAVQRIAMRRARPGSGSDLDLLMKGRRLMEWWAGAERALQDVPHAVVGGVAAAAYMPGRSTDDIDIGVGLPSVLSAEAALTEHGWTRIGPLHLVDGTIWQDPQGHELDLITLSAPWAQRSIQAAGLNEIAGMPTMPLPYLVLMKLQSGRLSDMSDLARMLGLAEPAVRDQARALVVEHGDQEDLQDLEQVIELGILETGPTGP